MNAPWLISPLISTHTRYPQRIFEQALRSGAISKRETRGQTKGGERSQQGIDDQRRAGLQALFLDKPAKGIAATHRSGTEDMGPALHTAQVIATRHALKGPERAGVDHHIAFGLVSRSDRSIEQFHDSWNLILYLYPGQRQPLMILHMQGERHLFPEACVLEAQMVCNTQMAQANAIPPFWEDGQHQGKASSEEDHRLTRQGAQQQEEGGQHIPGTASEQRALARTRLVKAIGIHRERLASFLICSVSGGSRSETSAKNAKLLALDLLVDRRLEAISSDEH